MRRITKDNSSYDVLRKKSRDLHTELEEEDKDDVLIKIKLFFKGNDFPRLFYSMLMDKEQDISDITNLIEEWKSHKAEEIRTNTGKKDSISFFLSTKLSNTLPREINDMIINQYFLSGCVDVDNILTSNISVLAKQEGCKSKDEIECIDYVLDKRRMNMSISDYFFTKSEYFLPTLRKMKKENPKSIDPRELRRSVISQFSEDFFREKKWGKNMHTKCTIYFSFFTDEYRRYLPFIQKYSFNNQILLLFQMITRDIKPAPLDTFQGWKRKGAYVNKGEKLMNIIVPCTRKYEKESKTGEKEENTWRKFFSKAMIVSQYQTSLKNEVDLDLTLIENNKSIKQILGEIREVEGKDDLSIARVLISLGYGIPMSYLNPDNLEEELKSLFKTESDK